MGAPSNVIGHLKFVLLINGLIVLAINRGRDYSCLIQDLSKDELRVCSHLVVI